MFAPLHLLDVDARSQSAEVRAVLDTHAADRAHGFTMGGLGFGAELLLVSTRGRLQIYTTELGHARLVRSVLGALHTQGGHLEGFGRTRVLQASGISVARQAFGFAAGLDHRADDADSLMALGEAAAHAAESATLGEELALLVSHATEVAWRVRRETDFCRASLTPELRETETPAVQRIVEEQLVTWQTAYSRMTGYPTSEYPSLEPTSMLRLKAARSLPPRSIRGTG